MSPKRDPRPLTVEQATAKLRAMMADPPYRHEGTATTFRWERPQWLKLREVIAGLPDGLPESLLDEVLATFYCIGGSSDLDALPASADGAILRFLAARERERDEVAFVLGALRVGHGTDRHAHLRELLRLTRELDWSKNTTRERMAALIAGRPDLVVGAQAAVAQSTPTVTSRYLPILAADGSPESIDVMLSFLEQARADASSTLDWLLSDLVPLFADTPAARAVIAMLRGALEDRADASPAKAWLASLGIAAPPIVQLTLTFRGPNKYVTFMARVDSTQASWFQGRLNAKWQWRYLNPAELAAAVPPGTIEHVLRTKLKGADRAKLEAWATSLLPLAARCT